MSRRTHNQQQPQSNKEYVTVTKKLDVPEEKLAEYREAFNMFDRNKKGTLSIGDITKIMKNFGYPMTKEEARGMISHVDASGDGEVDFDEFVMLMEKQVHNLGDDPVLLAFRDLDKNSDGKITNQEFRFFLTHVGENTYTDEEVDSLFKECGLKEDDELEYEEFILLWRSHMRNN
jgi:calmodulin